ncbi:hypothetical protein GGR52DRAFT_576570 [Hypoxylon sp. FL1284]|nr:hypothetical protein GGR52DRAFT_576570 [Hypoxylon sp. FL1284]
MAASPAIPVTELIVATVKPDVAESIVDSVIEATTRTLLGQTGCLRVRRSGVHGEPGKVWLFVDWASVERQRAYVANEAVRGPLECRMSAVLADRIPSYHVAFAPFPPAVLDGPHLPGLGAVELMHAYFPPDVDDDARAGAEAAVRDFADGLRSFTNGFTTEMALGWSVEAQLSCDGQPSRALVILIGWTSISAYRRAREDERYARIVPLLRNMEHLRGIDVCLVSCTTTEFRRGVFVRDR